MANKNDIETLNNSETTSESATETKKSLPEKVRVRIPIDRTKTDDVFVALNGKTYLIKRGNEVEVPIGVAKILEQSEKMTFAAMNYEAELATPLANMEKN